jgi:hypothetical protein
VREETEFGKTHLKRKVVDVGREGSPFGFEHDFFSLNDVRDGSKGGAVDEHALKDSVGRE